MNSRYVIFLLCTAALAFACGPWTHSQSASTVPVPHHKLSRTVLTTLNVVPTGSHVNLALQVTNNTPKLVELQFPNGQTHDFLIQDASGRVVWQWSTGRLFTQAMQSKTVHSKDSVMIEEEWDARNAHGKYVAVGTLNTAANPVERRVEFTLP